MVLDVSTWNWTLPESLDSVGKVPRFDADNSHDEEFVVPLEPPMFMMCRTGFVTGLLKVNVSVCVVVGAIVKLIAVAPETVPLYGLVQNVEVVNAPAAAAVNAVSGDIETVTPAALAL